MRGQVAAAALFVGLAAVEASAAVHLSIRDGRVWLRAERATVAEILTEWSRVGRTQIVNAERVSGSPVSLVLEGVPEREAIDIVLRSAGGYVAMKRAAALVEGSQFERIVVVPASIAAPAPVRAAEAPVYAPATRPVPDPAPVVTPSGARRIIGADGQPVPDDQDGAPPPPAARSIPPGFSPQPEPPPATAAPPAAPTAVPVAPVGVPRPGMIPAPVQPKKPGGGPATGL